MSVVLYSDTWKKSGAPSASCPKSLLSIQMAQILVEDCPGDGKSSKQKQIGYARGSASEKMATETIRKDGHGTLFFQHVRGWEGGVQLPLTEKHLAPDHASRRAGESSGDSRPCYLVAKCNGGVKVTLKVGEGSLFAFVTCYTAGGGITIMSLK
jgi:hypothetical protein